MTRRVPRWATYLSGMALVAVACGGSSTADAGPPVTIEAPPGQESTVTSESPTTSLQAAQGVLPEGPSALRDMNADEFPDPLVDPSAIISGGPPPDGIPPIDNPQFLQVADHLDLLEDDEPVVFVSINGDARAYPVQVMIWHEIVNDVVGGVPVSVTYCPLCNSAVAYRREINGVETTFGTSGRLFASALVMYDRATESLWTHFDGKAVVGVLTGTQLETIGAPLSAWSDFRAAHPDGKVLDPDNTGFARRYGANPYVGYDDVRTSPFLYRGALDDRAVAKQRIVGVNIADVSKAWTLQVISGGEAKATHSTVGSQDIVILWKSGQSSALDENTVYGAKDVGSVGVFVPQIEGQILTFRTEAETFVDEETGTTWNFAGEAIGGPLAGSTLERIVHLDTFWFAWATYRPDTELIQQ